MNREQANAYKQLLQGCKSCDGFYSQLKCYNCENYNNYNVSDEYLEHLNKIDTNGEIEKNPLIAVAPNLLVKIRINSGFSGAHIKELTDQDAVIVDQLISHGHSDNRFCVTHCGEQKIANIEVLKDLEMKKLFMEKSYEFHKENNFKYIKNSALTTIDQHLYMEKIKI